MRRVDGVGVVFIQLIGEEDDERHGDQPRADPHQLQAGIGGGLGLKHFDHVRGLFHHLGGGGREDAHHAEQRNDQHDDQQGPVEILHQAPVEVVVLDVLEKCAYSGKHGLFLVWALTLRGTISPPG